MQQPERRELSHYLILIVVWRPDGRKVGKKLLYLANERSSNRSIPDASAKIGGHTQWWLHFQYKTLATQQIFLKAIIHSIRHDLSNLK